MSLIQRVIYVELGLNCPANRGSTVDLVSSSDSILKCDDDVNDQEQYSCMYNYVYILLTSLPILQQLV